jgi:hypothetical protein
LQGTASTFTSSTRYSFSASQTATLLTATGSLGGIELTSAGTTAAAFLCFHKPGNYAAYLGIDTDNQLAFGGYSAGAALGYMKIGSFGVGTAASGVTGQIRATENIIAYYSDERLKTLQGTIKNALDKVLRLNGYYFIENDVAKSLGYSNDKVQVGVSAQEVEAVLPEIVTDAPIENDQNYKTVWYDKLAPLLIEAMKEQQAIIKEQQEIINQHTLQIAILENKIERNRC